MAQLRAATWPAHQRLEKRIDFKKRLATVDSYRAHLGAMWGFYVALEARLDECEFGRWLPDQDARRKLPLLERDLQALGAGWPAAGLPRCDFLPACDDPQTAFGCAYVLEGATLGGQTLLPLVATRLGLTAAHGAAFLGSYGADVNDMWRRFGAALELCCSTAPERGRAADAASATFGALERWLCEAPL
jgi:heme oxygenase